MTIAPVLKYATVSSIHTAEATKKAVSQTYYNMAGMASDKPFRGMNIVLTRYAYGSQAVTKTIR